MATTNSCPECNSTEVYRGDARHGTGGLRDEHQVFIPGKRFVLYADTYVCLQCGHVRLFLDEKSKADAAGNLPNDNGWTKSTEPKRDLP